MSKGLIRSQNRGEAQLIRRQHVRLKDQVIAVDGVAGVGWGSLPFFISEDPRVGTDVDGYVFLGISANVEFVGTDAGLSDTWEGDVSLGDTATSGSLGSGQTRFAASTPILAASDKRSPYTRLTSIPGKSGKDVSHETYYLNLLIDDADISADLDVTVTGDIWISYMRFDAFRTSNAKGLIRSISRGAKRSSNLIRERWNVNEVVSFPDTVSADKGFNLPLSSSVPKGWVCVLTGVSKITMDAGVNANVVDNYAVGMAVGFEPVAGTASFLANEEAFVPELNEAASGRVWGPQYNLQGFLDIYDNTAGEGQVYMNFQTDTGEFAAAADVHVYGFVEIVYFMLGED